MYPKTFMYPNGVLFTKEIPNELILLCMDYDVRSLQVRKK